MASSSNIPNEAPPSYDQAANAPKPASTATTSGGFLAADTSAAERRSMEDMVRPLPSGWVRQWDPQSHHNFFVDTRAAPPRSIWVHPFDDPQFQREHPDEVKKEKERIERERILQDDTDDEDETSGSKRKSGTYAAASGSSQPKGLKKLGRSLKDKMTSTTHEQRVQERKRREERERKAMEQHMMIRNALIRATQTGQPQFLGKDQQGREIFAQPPPPGSFRGGAQIGYGPYQMANGPYSRPMAPYGRPMMGGGGMAMPLLGGMLLGGLLF